MTIALGNVGRGKRIYVPLYIWWMNVSDSSDTCWSYYCLIMYCDENVSPCDAMMPPWYLALKIQINMTIIGPNIEYAS